jgi:hypothetical protein
MAVKRPKSSHRAQPHSNLAMKLHQASNCIVEVLVPALGDALLLDPRCAWQWMSPKRFHLLQLLLELPQKI